MPASCRRPRAWNVCPHRGGSCKSSSYFKASFWNCASDHRNVPGISASSFICHTDLDSCSYFVFLPREANLGMFRRVWNFSFTSLCKEKHLKFTQIIIRDRMLIFVPEITFMKKNSCLFKGTYSTQAFLSFKMLKLLNFLILTLEQI